MLQYERSEVIEECINSIESFVGELYAGSELLNSLLPGLNKALKTLEQFKTEVDALAEQEAEQMAKDLTRPEDDKLMKEGKYIENEVKNGNIKDNGGLGYLGAGREETYEEFTRNEYRREANSFSS